MVCATPRFPRDVPLNGSNSVCEIVPTNAFWRISVLRDQDSGTAGAVDSLLA
jgi:hypothetical protein